MHLRIAMAASTKKLHQERKIEQRANQLIRTILPSQASTENFKESLQFVLSNFKYHRYLDVNSHQIEKKLQGLYEKFEVNSQEKKAITLKALVNTFLASLVGSKPGLTKTNTHYAILSVLINLAETPTTSSVQDIVARRQDEVEAFDWTSYLLEGLPPLKRFSDYPSSDEEWTDDGADDNEVLSSDTLTEPSQKKIENTEASKLDESLVDHFWMSAKPITIKMRAAQIPHDWIASQGRLVHVEEASGRSITEDQLIRETLCLLMSPSNDGYVYCLKDGMVTQNTELSLSHLTKQSLSNTLCDFAHIGNMLHHLQSFVDSADESGFFPVCSTTRAFAGAIGDFLQGFRSEVVFLEEKCKNQDTIFTLSSLKESLSPWFHQITVVYQVFSEGQRSHDESCSSSVKAVISALEHALSREMRLSLSNVDSIRSITAIWMKTMRPYMSFLDHWLTTGIINNPTDEFSFNRNPDVLVHSDDYWTKSFVMPEDFSTEPSFLQPVYGHILEAGKAAELLQAMGFYVESFVSRQPGFTLTQDFEGSISRLLSDNQQGGSAPSTVTVVKSCWRKNDQVDPLPSDPLLEKAFEYMCEIQPYGGPCKSSMLESMTVCPLEVLLHRGLHPLLLDICTQINQRFMGVMREKYHLSEHLSSLKKYFLLESLDDLYDFYTELFEDLSQQEFSGDALFEHLLNWKLHDILKTRSQIDAERLFMTVESKDILTQEGLFINVLKLNYEVPWPINIVVSSSCLGQYNQIYQFLLSVKRVKYCMEQLNIKAYTRASEESVGSTEQLTKSLLHQLYLLRYKMLHFINAIHDYLMTRILHTTSLEFEDALYSADSLDHLAAIHERYLATITERCLLHPKLKMIREAVLKVLHMAVRFHRKWLLGIHTFSTDNIFVMNKDFNNCSAFLSSILERVTKKGDFPHLESLSVTIGSSSAT